jgi:hypothetical protein
MGRYVYLKTNGTLQPGGLGPQKDLDTGSSKGWTLVSMQYVKDKESGLGSYWELVWDSGKSVGA